MFEVVSRTSLAHALLRDDLFRVCSGSDHAEAVLLTVLPTSRIPVVAATACVVPFLLNPAAALGRMFPWHMHMKLQCMDLVAAFLLVVPFAVCTRQPPTASILVASPTERVWFAPEPLPAHDPVFARVRSCALWPMPAWVWRDVGSVLLFFGFFCPLPPTPDPAPIPYAEVEKLLARAEQRHRRIHKNAVTCCMAHVRKYLQKSDRTSRHTQAGVDNKHLAARLPATSTNQCHACGDTHMRVCVACHVVVSSVHRVVAHDHACGEPGSAPDTAPAEVTGASRCMRTTV